jgi:hypothetical protein
MKRICNICGAVFVGEVEETLNNMNSHKKICNTDEPYFGDNNATEYIEVQQ